MLIRVNFFLYFLYSLVSLADCFFGSGLLVNCSWFNVVGVELAVRCSGTRFTADVALRVNQNVTVLSLWWTVGLSVRNAFWVSIANERKDVIMPVPPFQS